MKIAVHAWLYPVLLMQGNRGACAMASERAVRFVPSKAALGRACGVARPVSLKPAAQVLQRSSRFQWGV